MGKSKEGDKDKSKKKDKSSKSKSKDEESQKNTEEKSSGKKKSKCTDDEYEEMLKLMDRLKDMRSVMQDSSNTFGEINEVVQEMEEAVEGLQNMCGSSQLIWKIEGFNEKYSKASSGAQTVIYSPTFESHQCGYNMAISLVPYGDGKAKGNFMSIFFCLLKGSYDNLQFWPFSHRVTFTLLDQTEDPRKAMHVTGNFAPHACKENMSFLGKPQNARNPSIGIPKFVSLEDMFDLDREYIREDTVFIRVRVHLDEHITV